jgi:predicted Zn-dependent protease
MSANRSRVGRLLATVVAIVILVHVYSVTGTRTVYLVPIEANPDLMVSLGSYYREQLGIEVVVLPSLPLTSAEWNPVRRQVIAEEVIQLMSRAHVSLRWPSRSATIGITARDMYIVNKPSWRFAFSFRSWGTWGRWAIVSYARMNPRFFGQDGNQQLLESRLRKMVTRNIGVLRYSLPLSPNAYNLMYRDVLGVDDLDRLHEDLRQAGFPPRIAAP